jgi:hypothetical protein
MKLIDLIKQKITNFKTFLEESTCPKELVDLLIQYTINVDQLESTVKTILLPYYVQDNLSEGIDDFVSLNSGVLDIDDIIEIDPLVRQKIVRYLTFFCKAYTNK